MSIHEWIESFKTDKSKQKTLMIVVCAIVLLIACYFVFFSPSMAGERSSTSQSMSETENKLCRVLSEIDGVGEISAYVNEDGEGRAIGCVIIMEGADRLSVRLDVIKAAALALGVSQNDVQIYKMTE